MKTDEVVPTEADWLAVGNYLRRAMGLPELREPCGIPSPEIIEDYNKITPGLGDRLVKMAENQARHRLEMNRLRRPCTICSNRAWYRRYA